MNKESKEPGENKKVILCGYHWTGCQALDLLQQAGHEVFVYTHESPPHIPSLIRLCQKQGVSYSTKNISKTSLPFTPDIIASIYYRYIIKPPVIDTVRGRIFNLHPALLPKYRGTGSLTWALINGETEAGFTYHYIDEGIDTGDIILQKSFAIKDWDTQETLYQRAMFEAMKYFNQAFDLVLAGFAGQPQQGESSYYSRGAPHGGVIDSGWDLAYIERFIRAMTYPPYPPATYQGQEVHTLDEFFLLVNDKKNA